MGEGGDRRQDRADVDAARRRVLVSVVVALATAVVPREAWSGPAPSAAPDVGTAADWSSILQSMFPHDRVDRALYAIPAGALVAAAEKDASARTLLAEGWRHLSATAGGTWAAADAERRTRALATIAGTPLFALLRQTTVFTFYNDPAVWSACGYEGDAWSFGGWLGKGVNTIDWLPDPPAAGRG